MLEMKVTSSYAETLNTKLAVFLTTSHLHLNIFFSIFSFLVITSRISYPSVFIILPNVYLFISLILHQCAHTSQMLRAYLHSSQQHMKSSHGECKESKSRSQFHILLIKHKVFVSMITLFAIILYSVHMLFHLIYPKQQEAHFTMLRQHQINHKKMNIQMHKMTIVICTVIRLQVECTEINRKQKRKKKSSLHFHFGLVDTCRHVCSIYGMFCMQK